MTKEEIQSMKLAIENERKKDYKEALEKILEILKDYEVKHNEDIKLCSYWKEDERSSWSNQYPLWLRLTIENNLNIFNEQGIIYNKPHRDCKDIEDVIKSCLEYYLRRYNIDDKQYNKIIRALIEIK